MPKLKLTELLKKNNNLFGKSVSKDTRVTGGEFAMMHASHDDIFYNASKSERLQTWTKSRIYNNAVIKFSASFIPGSAEMVVLQGLLSLAKTRGNLVEPEDQPELRLDAPAGYVSCKISELQKIIGFGDSGQDFKNIRKILDNLRKIDVFIKEPGITTGTGIIFQYRFYEETGILKTMLNYALAQALWGYRDDRKIPYIHYNMNEVRLTRESSEAAHILYSRLCSYVAPGKYGDFLADTLVDYINVPEDILKRKEKPITATDPDKVARILKRREISRRSDRRKVLIKALLSIDGLPGWSVEGEEGGAIFRIYRPRIQK